MYKKIILGKLTREKKKLNLSLNINYVKEIEQTNKYREAICFCCMLLCICFHFQDMGM